MEIEESNLKVVEEAEDVLAAVTHFELGEPFFEGWTTESLAQLMEQEPTTRENLIKLADAVFNAASEMRIANVILKNNLQKLAEDHRELITL